MSRGWMMAVVAAATWMPACGGDGGGGGAPRCDTDVDCEVGLFCESSRCTRQCRVAIDCLDMGDGYTCNERGRCVPPGGIDAGMRDGGGGGSCTADADCDDGVYCNGAESCGGGGTCVAAAPMDCDDGDPCTTDTCDESARACEHGGSDADGDGFLAAGCGSGDDCDDTDATRFPGNEEVCDPSHDEDCDDTTFGGRDGDMDGYEDSACCNGESCGDDCDDSSMSVHPASTDPCNTIDDDCDGTIDDGTTVRLYRDADMDNFGSGESMMLCPDTAGWVPMTGDCDDGNSAAHPTAIELCNGVDENCNTLIDDGAMRMLYPDGDGDGHGVPAGGMVRCPAMGWSTLSDDCNDASASVHPGAPETCNRVDDNCVGGIDEGVSTTGYVDRDGDMFGTGAAVTICPGTAGYASSAGDCNDSNATINPGATEICNRIDDNCVGGVDEGLTTTGYVDADGDMYGTGTAMTICPGTLGYASTAGDCNDGNASVNPGRAEVCNGMDDNCMGGADEGLGTTYYRDADGDGYGNGAVTMRSCMGVPPGYVGNPNDCNDASNLARPGGSEVCDGLDNDCNGATDEVLGATCTAGVGACMNTGNRRCDGSCTATAGSATMPWGHTTPAPNGSFDWDCDGVIERDTVPAQPVMTHTGTPMSWCSSATNMTACGDRDRAYVVFNPTTPGPHHCGEQLYTSTCYWGISCNASSLPYIQTIACH